ncbi:hypothetical protein, partial [Actinoplanes teichomyceticus]
MSYAALPPDAAPAPPPTDARPPAVSTASALLWLMGAAGLCYAVAAVAIAPGTVSRFRDAVTSDQAENLVSVVWLDAALAAVLSILAFALFVVLGLGLRRGSRVAWVVTLIVCGLGVLGGLGSFVTVLAQRSGDPVPGSVGEALTSAYPDGWIGLNVVVSGLQVLAYLTVAATLLAAPRTFFGHAPGQPGLSIPAGSPVPHGAPPPYGVPSQPYGAAPPPYGVPAQPYGAAPQPYSVPSQPYGPAYSVPSQPQGTAPAPQGAP